MTDTQTENHEATGNTAPTNGAAAQACGIACGAAGLWGLKRAFLRTLELCKDPKRTWSEIKAESLSLREMYIQYLIPVTLLAALASFIDDWLIGTAIPIFGGRIYFGFFGSLWMALLSIVLMLAAPFVAAKVFCFLAPKFEVTLLELNAFKLFIFAGLLSAFIQVTSLLSGTISFLLALAAGIYGIYLFLVGTEILADIPASKKWPYLGSSVLCTFFVMLLFAFVVAALSPNSAPNFDPQQRMNIPGMGQVSPEELNQSLKFLEQLQQVAPK
jgi:hypothetical protein